MILYYEDEPYFVQEYISVLQQNNYNIEVLDNAEMLLKILEEKYFNIDLIIIDIMIFGAGKSISGSFDDSMNEGIILIKKIEELEKSRNIPETERKKIIIFTNVKGEKFNKAKENTRVSACIQKSDLLPHGLLKLINKLLNKEQDEKK